MNNEKLSLADIRKYVENNIGQFHEHRLSSLRLLKLKQILQRKNSYLFKAKNIIAAPDLVKLLLDAHLSSQEETMFGEFLEGLAVHICGLVYGGRKPSNRPSIDLEFEKDDVYYVVSIKSGPNWGNADQIRKMRENFVDAKADIQQSRALIQVIPINGCCYGQDANPDKGDYFKYCGQDFWSFISGIGELYTQIIEPLGYKAREKNDEFMDEQARIVTNFTVEFANEFCENGKVDWVKLVEFNSAHIEPGKIIRERRNKYSAKKY
ncbi:MAG: cytosolic protein [Chloroflexi bacterium]|nr:cytosolic protein [Chloroflexota bacterium]MBP8059101.1 cytosolic protein [Chloroflexota bacterium]